MKKILLIVLCCFFSCSESKSEPNYIYNYKNADELLGKVGSKPLKMVQNKKSARFKIELFEKEMEVFNLKMGKLKESLIETLTEKKRGSLTSEAFLEKNVYGKITIEPKAITDFIKENNIPAVHINDQFKERIKQHLTMQQKSKALDAWMGKELKNEKIEVLFNKPSRPKFILPSLAGAPSTGPKNAKVTLVEFSDFQCPACGAAAPTLTKLKEKYKGKVNFVYKNYPLEFHKQAKVAGMGAMCVFEQSPEKFWKFHDHLFANQKNLSPEDLKKHASKFGIDAPKFDACLTSQKYKSMVEKDVKDGQEIGVFSTPTFFVNGKIVTGGIPFAQFVSIIEEELK